MRGGLRIALTCITSFSVSGCMVGPDFKPPARPSDTHYIPQSAPGTVETDGQRPELLEGRALSADWWRLLGSPEINDVVERALANNYVLSIARAQLASAGEQVKIARSGLFPQLGASSNVARRKYGQSFLGPIATTFPAFSAYSGGGVFNYDVDLFGRTRRNIAMAKAAQDVQREGLEAARLNVAAETVMECLQIAAANAQIDILHSVILSDEKNLKLVTQAHDAGVATLTDVTTAQSQLDHDRTLLPDLQQARDIAYDALAFLTGTTTARSSLPEFTLAKLTLPRNLPLVWPSEIVRARPDIRAAEAELHAANEAIGVATADMLPRLNLSATVGQQGLVGGPAGMAWSLVGGLSAPLFHGGALKAQKKAAQDYYTASFAQYQEVVITAFREMADSLHGLEHAYAAVETNEQALGSAGQALKLSRAGYAVGNTGVIQVIDAHRLEELAEMNLVKARTDCLRQTVSLFVASGGGVHQTVAAQH